MGLNFVLFNNFCELNMIKLIFFVPFDLSMCNCFIIINSPIFQKNYDILL